MNNELSILIIDKVTEFLRPYLDQFHKVDRIVPMSDGFEIKGKVKEEELGDTLVIKVLISHEHKQIQIPNIFMPEFMREKNIGKDIISLIHQVAKKNGFNLFISDLTNGFYNRLVNRGALVCEKGEVVLITDSTNLARIA